MYILLNMKNMIEESWSIPPEKQESFQPDLRGSPDLVRYVQYSYFEVIS